MTNEENILFTLKSIIENNFSVYIQQLNEEYNDDVFLDDISEVVLVEGSKKLPYFKLSIKNGEYEEKDRIIENEIYKVQLEFMLPQNNVDGWRVLFRYKEAFQRCIADFREQDGYWQWVKLRKSNSNIVELEFTV
jgi:hypothetical protein